MQLDHMSLGNGFARNDVIFGADNKLLQLPEDRKINYLISDEMTVIDQLN